MKVFISQPMRGRSDEEIMTVRGEAVAFVEQVLGKKVELIDSFFQEAPIEANPLWFLGKSIELMSKADVVVFVEGWADARGCRIEHNCAIEYDIDVMEYYPKK